MAPLGCRTHDTLVMIYACNLMSYTKSQAYILRKNKLDILTPKIKASIIYFARGIGPSKSCQNRQRRSWPGTIFLPSVLAGLIAQMEFDQVMVTLPKQLEQISSPGKLYLPSFDLHSDSTLIFACCNWFHAPQFTLMAETGR